MKSLILVIVLFFNITYLSACDVCSLYAGISPNDYKNTIGFYYRSRLMSGMYGTPSNGFHLKHGNADEKDKYRGKQLKEIYNVYEMRGSLFFKDRFQVMFSLPLVNNYRSVSEYTDFDIWGVGDPVVMFNGIIWATPSVSESKWKHRLIGGAGIKAPLGKTDKVYIDVPADIDIQPGTGSWDYLLNIDYSVRKVTGWGFQMNYIYRVNTYNNEKIAYGNFLNVTGNVFYQKK